MTQALALELARNALVQALLIGGPLLIVAVLVSILVSLFQAVTQIQDQTLAFVPKLFAIGAALVFGMSWMLQTLVSYTLEVFRSIPSLV
jgi:flagellar biosynthetic protein FliQ